MEATCIGGRTSVITTYLVRINDLLHILFNLFGYHLQRFKNDCSRFCIRNVVWVWADKTFIRPQCNEIDLDNPLPYAGAVASRFTCAGQCKLVKRPCKCRVQRSWYSEQSGDNAFLMAFGFSNTTLTSFAGQRLCKMKKTVLNTKRDLQRILYWGSLSNEKIFSYSAVHYWIPQQTF